MAITKISQFPTMSVSDVDSANDVLPIIDTNLGSNKKITLDNLGSSITSSYAITASYALNGGSGGGGGTTDTGSLLTTGSVSLNTLTFTKGNGDEFDLVVDTGSFSSFWGLDGPTTITASYNVIVKNGDFISEELISGSTFEVSNGGQIGLKEGSALRFTDEGLNTGGVEFQSGSFMIDNSTQITGSLIVSGSKGNITASGTVSTKNLFSSGSVKRKVREITLTVANSTGGGGMPAIQADDDIILITGNTTGVVGVSDYTLNCADIFYGNTSEIGRTVTIVNASTAVGNSLVLGSPTPGGNYTANAFNGTGRFGAVCVEDFTEVTIILRASNSVIIYGSGMLDIP